MIIYSVTISVDENIEQNWLDWMRKTHIPDMMNTGKFISCRLSKLTSHKEEGSRSYSAQYTCHSVFELKEYKEFYAERLRKDGADRFGEKIQAFRTELEIIEDYYSVLS
ncbi:MAG: DUF4286 family protein [Weeksellaceae bacterium]